MSTINNGPKAKNKVAKTMASRADDTKVLSKVMSAIKGNTTIINCIDNLIPSTTLSLSSVISRKLANNVVAAAVNNINIDVINSCPKNRPIISSARVVRNVINLNVPRCLSEQNWSLQTSKAKLGKKYIATNQ